MQRKGSKHKELEGALFDWVRDVHSSRNLIFVVIIQAKTRQLSQKANELLISDSQIRTDFSDGWLESTERLFHGKNFKLHGKDKLRTQ